MDARVVDEGPHHAVLVKPAGMVVVAGRGVPRPTLLDVAQQLFPGARPVHRLDRVTSGICIVAKTPFGQQALSDAFRRHLVDKRYLALVEGNPPWDKLDIDARLSRVDDPDAKKGPLAHQTIDESGVRALTRVRVLSRGTLGALLECRPETGRMHQIRAHLAHVGFPIVGDGAYGAKSKYVDEKGIGLVALAVSFPLPQGGRAFVVGPVPDEFKRALSDAGISASPIAGLVEKFTAAEQDRSPRTSRGHDDGGERGRGPRTSNERGGRGGERGRGPRGRDGGERGRGPRTSGGRGGRR
jgi:RluA family pseudouridine synthase